jgi:hypothetical protein
MIGDLNRNPATFPAESEAISGGFSVEILMVSESYILGLI